MDPFQIWKPDMEIISDEEQEEDEEDKCSNHQKNVWFKRRAAINMV
jgi:hypothetical protein